MPAITFADFSGGLDRRLPVTVQEASRLWILRNASTTTGKRIEKRPGLKLISGSMTGTVGLCAVNGRLKTFCTIGDVVSPPPQVDLLHLSVPDGLVAGQHLERIYSATVFNGFVYAVADYDVSNIYVGAISEGNTGGNYPGHVPPPRSPIRGASTV